MPILAYVSYQSSVTFRVMLRAFTFSDDTRRQLNLVIKDLEDTLVEGADVTITLDDQTKIDANTTTNAKGEFNSTKLDYNVGTKVNVTLRKANFEDYDKELLIGDGTNGLFLDTLLFRQTKVHLHLG